MVEEEERKSVLLIGNDDYQGIEIQGQILRKTEKHDKTKAFGYGKAYINKNTRQTAITKIRYGPDLISFG